ncbi:hypothetical protein EPO05_06245, partial [Patescibacteria group bacterium]
MPFDPQDPALAAAQEAERQKLAKPPVDPQTDAITHVEKAVGSAIPTDITAALAAAGLDTPALQRAARLAARYYDVTPQMLLRPGQQVSSFTSPITGGPMRMGEFRRLIEGVEPVALGSMVKGAIVNIEAPIKAGQHRAATAQAAPSVQRVAEVMRIVGKTMKDKDLPAADGISLAISLAMDDSLNLRKLESNLDAVKRWGDLNHFLGYERLVGIAVQATRQGLNMTSPGEVTELLNPELTAISESERQQLTAAGLTGDKLQRALQYWTDRYNALKNATTSTPDLPSPPADITPDQLALARAIPGTISLNYVKAGYAGSAGVDAYFKRAEEIKQNVVMTHDAMENNPINKVISGTFWVLDRANRAFELIAITAKRGFEQPSVGSPLTLGMTGANLYRASRTGDATRLIDPFGLDPSTQAAMNTQYAEDIVGAWHGKVRLADTLVRDWGAPRWQAEATEFLAGWFLDPLILVGKALRTFTLRGVNPDVLQALGKGAPSEERLLRYTEMVDKFSTKNASGLAKALLDPSFDATVRWARKFRTVMGETAFDLPFLDAVRKEMKLRGITEMSPEFVSQIEDVLRTHFMGKPELGSLADISYTARQEAANAARVAVASEPYDVERARAAAEATNAALTIENPNLLPRRLEVPKQNYPIPGMGAKYALGETYSQLFGDSTLGRNLAKLPNIDPGVTLKIHENPQRWFKLSARRAGLPDTEVVNWEARAVEAMGSPVPEKALASLRSEFESHVWSRLTENVGMTKPAADDLYKLLADQHAANVNAQKAFAAYNNIKFENGVPYIDSSRTAGTRTAPLGVGDLPNEALGLDPVVMKRFVSEYTGTVRRMRASFDRAFERDLPAISRQTRLPLAKWRDAPARPA